MGKLSMPASIFCAVALVAMAAAAGGEAAVVEHTFVVSIYVYLLAMCRFADLFSLNL